MQLAFLSVGFAVELRLKHSAAQQEGAAVEVTLTIRICRRFPSNPSIDTLQDIRILVSSVTVSVHNSDNVRHDASLAPV